MAPHQSQEFNKQTLPLTGLKSDFGFYPLIGSLSESGRRQLPRWVKSGPQFTRS